MIIKCPHCGAEYETDQKSIGMSVVCDTCRRSFIIRSTTTGEDMTTLNKPSVSIGNDDAGKSYRNVSTSQNIPLWICAGILLANFITLVCICRMMYGNTVEIKQTGTTMLKELSNMGEDLSNIDGILQSVKKELSSMSSAVANITSKLEDKEIGVIIEGTRNSDNNIYRPIPR